MVSVEDLKKEIKEYNWEVLVENDSPERALEKARIWVKAKIIQAGGIYNEEDEIIALALIKRALYELYSFAENEEVAKDKKEDSIELLRARFGSAIDSNGYASNSGQNPIAKGAFVNGRVKKRG